jgi:hypothetical protein
VLRVSLNRENDHVTRLFPGRTGSAVTFFTEDDIPALRSVANVMRLSGCDVPEWMLTLKKLRNRGTHVVGARELHLP